MLFSKIKTFSFLIETNSMLKVEDETLAERLWGLTEMFPEKVRDATFTVYCGTKTGLKCAYSNSYKKKSY